MTKRYELELAGRTLVVETGLLALQAGGSCTVQYGDTLVMANATMSHNVREGIAWFPLMVDYEEKLYAAGKIKGSRFIKREGRPTDNAVLTGRMIDRGLRPLFDQTMRNDVQVVTSVLSYDGVNSPDTVAITAASIALTISDIPWNGPLVGLRAGYIDGEYVLNPTIEQQGASLIDLTVSASADKVLMVEAGAKEASEDIVAGGFEFLLEQAKPVIEFINAIRAEVGKEKYEVPVKVINDSEGNEVTADAFAEAKKAIEAYLDPLWAAEMFNIPVGSKGERKEKYSVLKERAEEHFLAQGMDPSVLSKVLHDFHAMAEAKVSAEILNNDNRVDGRGIHDVRALSARVGLLPRAHGTGLFSRGETQVLSVVTLGAPGDEQVLDGMEINEKKHYMHHYNFPPYSVGDVSPLRGASRRDIGHGALAEKALEPVLPAKEDFPYTIRVVSEVLGSNGSSSMASACGSSLALLDAGVPLVRPVAGVAIGLASGENGAFKVFTDLQDMEDGLGGMDFKVCGTTEGVTAIQMDTKTDGLTLEIIREALDQARNGRLHILDTMSEAISTHRAELSPYAPRITTMKIDPEKIRDVIGAGGKVINEIIEKTGVSIDIEDDGTVFITAPEQEGGIMAEQIIRDITRVIEQGEKFTATVKRLMQFGAIVDITPNQEALLHISEIEHKRVEKVEDVLKVGDSFEVVVSRVEGDKLQVSRKRLLPKPEGHVEEKREKKPYKGKFIKKK
jgi:polyribonucleotide nucleotidyltransferase